MLQRCVRRSREEKFAIVKLRLTVFKKRIDDRLKCIVRRDQASCLQGSSHVFFSHSIQGETYQCWYSVDLHREISERNVFVWIFDKVSPHNSVVLEEGRKVLSDDRLVHVSYFHVGDGKDLLPFGIHEETRADRDHRANPLVPFTY